MRILSTIFGLLAVLLSDIMCAVVAYNYCALLWGGQFAGYSVPASTAFTLAIPYVIGIVVCVILAVVLRKRKNSCPEQRNIKTEI